MALTKSYFTIMGLHPMALGLCVRILEKRPLEMPQFRDCYPVQYDDILQVEAVVQPGEEPLEEDQEKIDSLRNRS